MIYLKKYESSVPNTKRTLERKVEIAPLLNKIQEPKLWLKCSVLEDSQKLNFWDLGKTASEHISLDDTIYIMTLNDIYIGKIFHHIHDNSGKLGDLFGWSKIHNALWINVISFKRVSILPLSPGRETAIRKTLAVAKNLKFDFFQLKERIRFP
jgi:hypothetical protein